MFQKKRKSSTHYYCSCSYVFSPQKQLQQSFIQRTCAKLWWPARRVEACNRALPKKLSDTVMWSIAQRAHNNQQKKGQSTMIWSKCTPLICQIMKIYTLLCETRIGKRHPDLGRLCCKKSDCSTILTIY